MGSHRSSKWRAGPPNGGPALVTETGDFLPTTLHTYVYFCLWRAGPPHGGPVTPDGGPVTARRGPAEDRCMSRLVLRQSNGVRLNQTQAAACAAAAAAEGRTPVPRGPGAERQRAGRAAAVPLPRKQGPRQQCGRWHNGTMTTATTATAAASPMQSEERRG